MSSELLGAAQNVLKGNLGGAWDINKGYADAYTDLGIARRFGGASAAYSLRDIGAMNGRVVRVRRNSDDTEEDFSANQVQSGVVENFCNEVLTVGVAVEGGSGTDRPDSFTNATNSSFTATVTEVAGGYFPYKTGAGDVITISFDLVLSGAASPSACTSTSVSTVNSASNTVVYTSSGSYTSSFTCTADATHFRFADGDDGTFAVTNFQVTSHISNGFVETWYDQSGNGEDMTQGTAGKQPSIVLNGGQVKDYKGNNSIDFVSGSTRVLDKSGTTTAKTCIVVLDEDSSGSASRAILGFSDSTSFMRLDAGTDLELKAGGSTANYRAIPTDVTSLYFWYTNGTDEDKLFANNVEEGDLTANTPPNLPFTRIGARNSDSDPYNSRITEVIAFAEDLSADRTVLQDDINNNYNIF